MRLGVTRIPFDVPRLNLVNERFFLLYSARKALTTQMAAFELNHIEPTAVFGGSVDRSLIRDSFRLRRIKCFIK
jgi:hypothetical protein